MRSNVRLTGARLLQRTLGDWRFGLDLSVRVHMTRHISLIFHSSYLTDDCGNLPIAMALDKIGRDKHSESGNDYPG